MAGKVRPPGIIMCPALERLNPSLTIHPAKSADLFGVLTATGAAPRPGTRKGKPRGFAVAILQVFDALDVRRRSERPLRDQRLADDEDDRRALQHRLRAAAGDRRELDLARDRRARSE